MFNQSILGIGIDSVEIDRFAQWHTYCNAQLKRILSIHEIEYCRRVPVKSAERFAVRFAAREALFKALCQANMIDGISFLTVCSNIEIAHASNGVPLVIFKNRLSHLAAWNIHLSITHTSKLATAFVIISNNRT